MSLEKLISNYSAYNEWANRKLTDWLLTVDENLLSEKTPSSYPNIDITAQHITKAQQFWLSFITQTELVNFSWRPTEGNAKASLNLLAEISTQMREKFVEFNESELCEILKLETRWAKNELNRYEYIMHVINHSTYHRGQIITMARSHGITEGVVNTDYNMFLS
jgi:uncharacterized damage-inducible protein DinB